MWDAWASNYNAGNAVTVGVFNHIPGGCNVLYMDGHVEFLKYGTKPPVYSVPGGTKPPTNLEPLGVYFLGDFTRVGGFG